MISVETMRALGDKLVEVDVDFENYVICNGLDGTVVVRCGRTDMEWVRAKRERRRDDA